MFLYYTYFVSGLHVKFPDILTSEILYKLKTVDQFATFLQIHIENGVLGNAGMSCIFLLAVCNINYTAHDLLFLREN